MRDIDLTQIKLTKLNIAPSVGTENTNLCTPTGPLYKIQDGVMKSCSFSARNKLKLISDTIMWFPEQGDGGSWGGMGALNSSGKLVTFQCRQQGIWPRLHALWFYTKMLPGWTVLPMVGK